MAGSSGTVNHAQSHTPICRSPPYRLERILTRTEVQRRLGGAQQVSIRIIGASGHWGFRLRGMRPGPDCGGLEASCLGAPASPSLCRVSG